ncbi:MAG: DUF3853 family protein [Muribaculaceae bacterium]|nr:DUF3853 family protein [Muribaculaceae bacterium]
MPDNQVIVLTFSQLKELSADLVRQALETVKGEIKASEEVRYVYGLSGIANLFNVSRVTAQNYKNTFLKPAVEQRNRKFRVNVTLAQQLFAEHNAKPSAI